ncbi:MAG: pseudouridine synthase, partial [Brachybacterium sp.]|nr:pseudouridine synthase [Brachybacterium sp.]
MSEVRTVPVPDGLAGERVDVGIARLFGLSRTKAADLVMSGAVDLDGEAPARSTRLEPGVMLTVEIPTERPAVEVRPSIAPGMALVYEDEDIVVVDKPVGVAAHPSAGWSGPTVLGHLAAAGVRITAGGPEERRGVVSRLDVGTSGLMVLAKSERAYPALKESFSSRQVEKVYHALAQGHLDPDAGTIEAPIGRSKNHDYKYAVMTSGKHAVTHYEVTEQLPGADLLR